MASKTGTLKLGQYASSHEIEHMIHGAITVLGTIQINQNDRREVNYAAKNYRYLQSTSSSEVRQSTMETIWLRLEEIINDYLPPWSKLDDLDEGPANIIPNWDAIKDARENGRMGDRRTNNQWAPEYVIELDANADNKAATLYRKVHAGRGHVWRPLWTANVLSEPVEPQPEQVMP